MKAIAIIGASGAIGSAFMRSYAKRPDVRVVYALSRSEKVHDSEKIVPGFIDLMDEPSIEAAAELASSQSPLDFVIVASGMLHNVYLMPEKSLRDLSAEKFRQAFALNAIGPALVVKHFLPKLHRGQRTIFAALSARVGSISDNRLGGWYSYRVSKSALNMIIKNASIEMARRSQHAIVVGLHPGTVDSPLSKPFQQNVSANHLFEPDYAVARLITVLEGLQAQDSGKCFAHDGEEVLP